MKKIVLFSFVFVFALTLTWCSPKETWTNTVDSVKSIFWMQTNGSHWAAWELDLSNFDGLLENVDANAVDEQKVINCLNDKWVAFYGWASCWYSCDDVKKYWKKMKEFPCIDCDENEALCDMANIKELPVWAWEWKQVKNITSLNDLAIEFGCDE